MDSKIRKFGVMPSYLHRSWPIDIWPQNAQSCSWFGSRIICVHKEENDLEWKNIFVKLSFWREIWTKLADQWSQKLGNPTWGQAGIKMKTNYFLVILSKSHRWRDIWDTKLAIVIYAVLLVLPSESNLKVLILSTRQGLGPLSICPKMHFALISLAKKGRKIGHRGGLPHLLWPENRVQQTDKAYNNL